MPEWVYTLPWDLIRDNSGKFSLDPYIVASIVMVESGNNTNATRYEPQWIYHLDTENWAKRIGCSRDTEFIFQASSWGLMQVMGTVAREHGFGSWFPELCLPAKGLYYGCKHLAKFRDRYEGNINDAISAYNQGSPRKDYYQVYQNQEYVNNVLSYHSILKQLDDEIKNSN